MTDQEKIDIIRVELIKRGWRTYNITTNDASNYPCFHLYLNDRKKIWANCYRMEPHDISRISLDLNEILAKCPVAAGEIEKDITVERRKIINAISELELE